LNKVDHILSTVDMLTLIPPDTKLRSVGRDRWRGRCPIDSQGSDAFSVMRHKDGHLIFSCFSCHERGSVIDLFAKLEGISVGEAIRILSKDLPAELSHDTILQRAYDRHVRDNQSAYILVCSIPGCFSVKKVETELDAAVLCSGSSWQWKVSRNGSKALCWKHN
jgi:hypothetical protein